MSRYLALFRYDFRQIMRDPMLAACLFGPLMLTMIVRFFFAVLDVWLRQRYLFDLSTYDSFILPFLLTAITMLPGCMAGLLILDERDEYLIAYYAVTPISRIVISHIACCCQRCLRFCFPLYFFSCQESVRWGFPASL